MPIPTPRADESEDDFISRCMSNDTMKDDYPDTDQRLAVCYRSWEDKKTSADDSTRESLICIAAGLETFADGTGSKLPQLRGYAALYDVTQELWPGYSERLTQGMFAQSLKGGADVRALFNHDPNLVLGRNKSNPPTLTIHETVKGLKTVITPPDTQLGRDTVELVKRGDVSQMSIGFIVQDEDAERHDNGEWVRILKAAELLDVSVVTYPAFPDTSVAVKRFEKYTGKRIIVPVRLQVEPQDPETIRQLATVDELRAKYAKREAVRKERQS